MIRAAVLVIALLVSPLATAENWQLVKDSANGLRLVADVDSLRVETYKNDNNKTSFAVSAIMSYVESQGEPVTFITGISGEDCVYKDGGIIINVYVDRSESKYVWSKQGNKFYDAQAQMLCRYFAVYVEETVSKAKPKEKKIRM